MSLKVKMKEAHPIIRQCLTSLKAENLKLQKQIGKLETKIMSLNNRIKDLEKRKGPSLEEVLSQIEGKKLKQH